MVSIKVGCLKLYYLKKVGVKTDTALLQLIVQRLNEQAVKSLRPYYQKFAD